jgi:hypothetical protein
MKKEKKHLKKFSSCRWEVEAMVNEDSVWIAASILNSR